MSTSIEHTTVTSPSPLAVQIEGAGQMIGIGRTMVYDLLNQGELESVKIGRRRVVTVASIEAYLARLINEASGTANTPTAGGAG